MGRTSGLRTRTASTPVKYGSDGTFVSQIGKTGFRYGTGQSLEFVADVGVDSAGNIWLVDNDANHVLKFDASGKYLSMLGKSYNSWQSNDRFSGPHSIALRSLRGQHLRQR